MADHTRPRTPLTRLILRPHSAHAPLAAGSIGQGNYPASKSALFGLTESLAREPCIQLARACKALGPPIFRAPLGYLAHLLCLRLR